jgi:steroid Delta-isomerase
MIDANYIRKLYDRYPDMVTKGDVEGIVALYAADATIEDPIGGPLHRGIDAVRAFDKEAAGTVTMKRVGPVHVAGREAATPLRVLIGAEGSQKQVLDIISVMAFNDDGKVASMRAFWSFDAMRPATPED